MKISGTAVLNAPVDQVWAAFNDPAVLARTIPGCQELREVGPDAYTMTVMAGVASIKGIYEGNVALTEQNPPSFFVLRAAGAGAPGTVGGVIGGVGQRMLTGVAKKMAGQFFAAVDADIAGLRAPGEMPEAALVPVGAPRPQVTYAGPSAVGRPPFQGRDFLYGALAGAAIALAGVAVGIAAGGR